MLLRLDSDQESFRETTAKFLADLAPVEELRRRRNDPAGFDADYWRRGAELGWMSFLVSEEHGGGSISGAGIVDLAVVAYEIGRHAAPGPLGTANIVAGALSIAGAHADVLAGLLAGTTVATWCLQEPPSRGASGPSASHGALGSLGNVALDIRVDADEVVLNGVKRPVESAAQASHLLVTGRTDSGLTQVLAPADAPGVTTTPMHSVDLTRRFSVVRFTDVRLPLDALVGEPGGADADVQRQSLHALALSNAESVGAMQAAFDLTVAWAFDRYSFGRPLASYQALKHQFADMKTWLEAGHGISAEGSRAVADGADDAASLVSAAKAFIGGHGGELMQQCVQLHGGLGVTFEHDIHLYLRRHAVNQALLGTPAEHRLHLTDLAQRQESRA